ncbi:hypothetical protein AAK964_12200 [Tissierella praeacuta]|uniref:hypothetical protein n=1 Tax=Tissierella praeacuta TaxID=43131 RepID=UPI003512F876
MTKIKKSDLDLDITIVKLKLILKNRRDTLFVNCTATQAMEFIDYMNENNAVVLNKYDREKMENKFYIFDDIANKKTVMVSIPDVKYMEVPFFIDAEDDNLDLKILTYNN